ncbi:hypothetical protein KM043_018042 [Ampulex compressa]|nr:hypothetical protein KM043_018042 [Ampulex compressa]
MSKNDNCATAETLKRREKYLTTGCQKIDTFLKGGMFCRGITEIYGAAGTGKTQLALQLALTVQLPMDKGGLAAGAVYICTQSAFPSKRLQQLIERLEVIQGHQINGDKIFVQHICTIEELELCITRRIPILLKAERIGLVVIDSIAAPYRTVDWKENNYKRLRSLHIIGRSLHKLCINDDICIICINQVAAVIDKKSRFYENVQEQPTLGRTWERMKTNSMYLYRHGPLRYANVRSPRLCCTVIPYAIHESGVKGVG